MTALPWLPVSPVMPDRCEAIDGTIIDGHFYLNAAKGTGRVLWICTNCGRVK